jgi:endoglucanase
MSKGERNYMAADVLEYLRELVALSGPSGAEEQVAQTIGRLVRPLADSLELDPFGNLIVVRQATDPEARRLVLAAHMDEVGFLIRGIDPDGFLRIEKLGGTDPRVLLAQRVWVRGSRGRLLGVIGTRSAHLQRETDRTTVPTHADLYLDIGARDADEVARMGVRQGDPAGFVGELTELGLGTGRFTAHALDDRAGCAVLLALLARFAAEPPPVSVIALFTVQEEVGLRGARAATLGRAHDLALAVDTTAVDDTPECGTQYLRLGGGPAIKIMDFSHLAHPAVRRGLLAAAEDAEARVQQEILAGIGTDAGALQFAGRGTPAGTLSLGTRYTHSPVEVLDRVDLEAAVELLYRFTLALPTLDLRFTTLDPAP